MSDLPCENGRVNQKIAASRARRPDRGEFCPRVPKGLTKIWCKKLRRNTDEITRARDAKDAKEDEHAKGRLGLCLASLAALARKEFGGKKAGLRKGHDGRGSHSTLHRSICSTFNRR
jgi:hypothetical protein